MIEVENLQFRHHSAGTDVVKHATFAVPKGKLAVLLGPNGSGKTTLFKCIANIWKPRTGKIRLHGRDTKALSFRKRACLLAVVPQEHRPPFPYSVLEVVLMGRTPHVQLCASPSPNDRQIALAALADLGIAHLARRVYTRISGGERQLVLIARALAQASPILLLDEPTSHLDFRNQYVVLTMVRRVAVEKRLTVLMTLHDPNLAAHFAHQVILLKAGRVTAAGPPEKVLTKWNLEQLYGVGIGIMSDTERRLIYPRQNGSQQ